MQLAKKYGTSTMLAFAVAAGAILWGVLAAVFLAQPFYDIVVFIFYQCAAVALPGFAITKLFKMQTTPLESFVAAYGFGVTAIVAVYFLFAPFGAMQYVKYVVAGLAAAAVVVLNVRRKQPLSAVADTGEARIAVWACAFAALATFVLLSMSTLNPNLSGARAYFHDTTNGVALTTAASYGFPMQILQMSGTDHWYHIFFFSYNAVFKLISGISSFEIVTKLSLITLSPFIAAAFVMLAKRVIKKNAYIWIAAVLFLVVPSTYNVHYLYQDAIGYPMGLAFALLCVFFFLKAQQTPCKLYNRYYAVSSIFLMMCVGAKGPVAVTVLFAVCFALLLSLMREKRWNVIVQGLMYAAPFFALYFLLYQSGVSDSMSWSPLYNAMHTNVFYWLHDTLPYWLTKAISTICYTLLFDPLATIAVVLALVVRGKTSENAQPFTDVYLGGMLVGCFLINTFKQIGSSETYFLLVMVPFAYIALMRGISCLLAKREQTPKKAGRMVLAALFVPCLIINMYYSVITYTGLPKNYGLGLTATFQHSLFSDKITTEPDINALLSDEDTPRRAVITPQEYEAMLWIRDNTPQDSIIADGRYLKESRYFSGSAFSERAFFLEGFAFVTMGDSNDNTPEKVRRDTFLRFFYEEEDEGYLLLMAREGCDYVIISEYINPGFVLSNAYCDEVFRNEHVTVYKLHALPA